jgi:hypothetical protein
MKIANHKFLQGVKAITLVAVASFPLGLNCQNLPPAVAILPKIEVEQADIRQVELGVWEGVVDLSDEKTTLKQVKGNKKVLVASLLGNGTNVTATIAARLYKNKILRANGGNNFASLSLRWRITNNTGATLGEATAGNPTGMWKDRCFWEK